MDKYKIFGAKKLKYGYTTGTCAAAATQAATAMLLGKERISNITIQVPKGWMLTIPIKDIQIHDNWVSCAVSKDSGDDPDITNGILIYSKVRKNNTNAISIFGGKGIGKITRKGLSVEVGEPAINPVPREMIMKEAKKISQDYCYNGGLEITISVPEGEEKAKKTFNPKLGIEGGISIIGTTGIVEPMSEKALIESLKLELNVHRKNGNENVLLTPGNYGLKFATDELLLDTSEGIKISNYIGLMMESVRDMGFKNVLFIAHAGKLIKVAGGIMNTHSKYGDARMEILAAHASYCGGESSLIREIMGCITTDEAIDKLNDTHIYQDIMDSVMGKVEYHLLNKINYKLNLGIIMYTNTQGVLSMNERAKDILSIFK